MSVVAPTEPFWPPRTRYVWILKHEDGVYVDRLFSNGRYFGYAINQRDALRFTNEDEARKALATRDAFMRALDPDAASGKVRVVRLKLKEKT
jgi:hypothetical protein